MGIEQYHDEIVGPAAEMGGEEAERGARDGADAGTGEGDGEADADGGEEARQHVATKIVGASGVVPGATEQRQGPQAGAKIHRR
jgi:hypothetical protein